jgi:uncharacterized protein (DUF2252 family)
MESNNGASKEERKALGKEARQHTPLEAHAKLHINQSGRDIIEILEKSNEGRIEELVPLRYGRMQVSPFTFFRGTAGIMARDLAATPNSSFTVQACGDCHIQNFGAFATPERKIVVDINDFDETMPAPWEWDVKRLAASLVLAANSNGLPQSVGKEAARLMAEGYRKHMAELAQMTLMEVWYSQVEFKNIMDISTAETRRRSQKLIKEAMEKSSPEVMLEKLTVVSDGKLRFKEIPPLLCHMEGISAGEQEQEAFEAYRQSLPDDRRVLLDKFKMIDIVRKVVGIGSVGTMCGLLLLVSTENDILLLQVKEARDSVLAPYVEPSRYQHNGQRVVNGQKLMQAASDMFLGWTTGQRELHRHFYIRQLRDVKVGVNTAYWEKDDFKAFPKVAGEILARAHARSSDATVLRGYMGKSSNFDEAIAEYGTAYARQTEEDYQQFMKACKSGKLTAMSID